MIPPEQLLTVVSLCIALASVLVSFYAVRQARKTALTGTYFSEMTQAYAEFLRYVTEFAFRRGAAERDALAASLYRLRLFASPEIFRDAQQLYAFLLAWASSNPSEALALDEKVHNLGDKMRFHLDQTRKRGEP